MTLLDDFPFRAGVARNAVSELQKWEGPDPAYWCHHGYAVVNPDARGAFSLERRHPLLGHTRRGGMATMSSNGWQPRSGAMARSGCREFHGWPLPSGSSPRRSLPTWQRSLPGRGGSDAYREDVVPWGCPGFRIL